MTGQHEPFIKTRGEIRSSTCGTRHDVPYFILCNEHYMRISLHN